MKIKKSTNVDKAIRIHKYNFYREKIVIIFLLIEIEIIVFSFALFNQ